MNRRYNCIKIVLLTSESNQLHSDVRIFCERLKNIFSEQKTGGYEKANNKDFQPEILSNIFSEL